MKLSPSILLRGSLLGGLALVGLAQGATAQTGADAERVAPLAIRTELQAERAAISKNKWQFTVGITSATGKQAQLCGTRVPSKDQLASIAATASKTKPVALKVGPPRSGLASAVNWQPYMGAVRNQGSCGSCWAFATDGVLDASFRLLKGTWQTLSEEQLLDCTAGSCSGYWPEDAMRWIVGSDRGQVTNATYPYVGTKTSCLYPSGGPYKASGWWQVPRPFLSSMSSTTDLKTWVATYGPIVTCIYADSYFCNYRSGIFNNTNSSQAINHAIVIVGYDDSKGAFRIRNSWGTGWGESGYAWVKYGANRIGDYSSLIQAK